MRSISAIWLLVVIACSLSAAPALAKILVPMDLEQSDHLRAYGVAFHALERSENVEWLLNYRGGSFLLEDTRENQRECLIAGIYFRSVDGNGILEIYDVIEANNMEVVLLEKAPRI